MNGTASKSRRVLLVESDPCSRDTVRYYLAKSGYTVVAIENRRDALNAVMAGNFALVLCDPMTPGLEGGAFHEGLRRIDPGLCERLVFLVGHHTDAGTIACIKKLDGFVLRKPFDSLDLIDAIFTAETNGTLEGVFDRASSIPPLLIPADGGKRLAAGADAVERRIPDEVNAAALKKGQVLLVESDSCFRETVRSYLSESGYTVAAFQNNRDALREVLAGDFALVLYDPTAPELPADMFYQGVRRIDPELCERMVFLIADHNDARTSAFIKKIDGFVLRKPFDAKSLADRIAASEVLGTLHGAFESASTDPGLSGECLSGDGVMAAGAPRPHVAWFAETLSEAPAETPKKAPAEAQGESVIAPQRVPVERLPAPGPSRVRIPAFETETRSPEVLRALAFAGLAVLFIVLMTWSKSHDAESRAKTEARRTAISHRRDKITTSVESESEAPAAAEAAGDHPAPPPAVHDIAAAASEEIELAEVRVLPSTEDPDVFEVRIRGAAGGSQPKVAVERFRQVVETGLTGNENRSIASARIAQFEQVPGTLPDQKRTRFLIFATVSSIKSPVATEKQTP
jgi:CheY-like chemotaxis protein